LIRIKAEAGPSLFDARDGRVGRHIPADRLSPSRILQEREHAMTTMTSPTTTTPSISDAAMASTTDALQSLMSTYGDCRQEIAHFVDLRLAHNLDSWTALTTARDVTGIMRAQQEWGMQTAADYFNGTARFAQLFTSLTLAGVSPGAQHSIRHIV
jgi:hypothetical protein